MNKFGAQAERHWRKWLPKRVGKLEDPEKFFSELGEEVESRIQERSTALAGDDRAGEAYMEKLGRLNMARATAESEVLREMVLLEPEQSEEAMPHGAPG